jgi:hypothetical protein
MSDPILQDEAVSDKPRKVYLYSLKQIGWSSALFGPGAGALFISKNYKLLGDEGAGFRIALSGQLAFVIFGIAVQFLTVDIGKFTAPILFAVIMSALTKHFQHDRIEKLHAEGTPYAPTWRVLVIGLLALAMSFALFFVTLIALDTAFPGFLPLDEDATMTQRGK